MTPSFRGRVFWTALIILTTACNRAPAPPRAALTPDAVERSHRELAELEHEIALVHWERETRVAKGASTELHDRQLEKRLGLLRETISAHVREGSNPRWLRLQNRILDVQAVTWGEKERQRLAHLSGYASFPDWLIHERGMAHDELIEWIRSVLVQSEPLWVASDFETLGTTWTPNECEVAVRKALSLVSETREADTVGFEIYQTQAGVPRASAIALRPPTDVRVVWHPYHDVRDLEPLLYAVGVAWALTQGGPHDMPPSQWRAQAVGLLLASLARDHRWLKEHVFEDSMTVATSARLAVRASLARLRTVSAELLTRLPIETPSAAVAELQTRLQAAPCPGHAVTHLSCEQIGFGDPTGLRVPLAYALDAWRAHTLAATLQELLVGDSEKPWWQAPNRSTLLRRWLLSHPGPSQGPSRASKAGPLDHPILEDYARGLAATLD